MTTDQTTTTDTQRPRHRWVWPVVTVLALFVGIIIGAAATGTETGEVRTVTETETETVEVESQELLDQIAELEAELAEALAPEPEPELAEDEAFGQFVGNCDSQITEDNRYLFLATVEVENTSNVDIEADVWVEFKQLGTDPIRYTESVAIAAGQSETVHFDEEITGNEWDRYASANFECDLDVDRTAP